MEKELIYTEFKFNEYFERYIKKNGISRAFISRILGLSYSTLRTKFDRNSFTYSEVLYLDSYYKDLCFTENYRRYLGLRNLIQED